MTSIGTGYDASVSQFSPDGRIFQIEYAMKAIDNSGTVIGLRGKDGVVLAVENQIISKLYEPYSNKRIFNIDYHIGMALCGLISDARKIVEVSRKESANYKSQYSVAIPTSYLENRVSMYMHMYTLYSSVRPFGCSVIIGSCDANGPLLYMIDPSGLSYGYHACAIGKSRQAAKTEIEKLHLNEMSIFDLVKEATRIVYMIHDELKSKKFKLELSWVGNATQGKHERVPSPIFEEAVKFARQSLEIDSNSTFYI